MPSKLKLLPMEKVDGKHAVKAREIFNMQQMLYQRAFGISLEDMIEKDKVFKVPDSSANIKGNDLAAIRQAFKVEDMPDVIKQATILTSTGTEAFMLNEAAAGYFGASTGVFNPAILPGILEGNALKGLISKLWGVQPFAENDLSAKLIYFKKSDPFKADGTPAFERKAEGRAGNDIGFEVGSEHVDAQRNIVHLPYSYELQKILAGRLGLDAKVMEAFSEAAMYRDEYWCFLKWYLALTAGTLEGVAFKLYRDGTIADVDGIPEGYICFYNLFNGTIKAGDSTAYGSATQVETGADISDLLSFVIEVMAGTKPVSSLDARGYRYCWTPDYVAVPQKVANKMWREFKDSNLQTVYISKNDIPEYKADVRFFCRANVGNIPLDIWVIPDEVLKQLAIANASTFVTTDSPTYEIYPMFFGRYTGMGAIAPASPDLFFVDDGFEVVTIGGVSTLRRNMQKVHTMFKLGSEMLLNASMSFLVKVIDEA